MFKIGLELEFYLTKERKQIDNTEIVNYFTKKLAEKLVKEQIKILSVKKEQGAGQIEITTIPSTDISSITSEIDLIKKYSIEIAKKESLEVNFKPRPFLDDCPSALQINLTFLKESSNNSDIINLFDRNNGDESEILLNIIATILSLSKDNLQYFSNKERFDLDYNKKLFLKRKYTAPVNLSWGYDNRSCAIRVTGKKQDRRLEFRLCDADINIENAINKLIEIANYGILNKVEALKPIYGNAFDDNYKKITRLLD